MLTNTGPLLAKDGAEFHAHLVPGGWNQMVLKMEVRLEGREPERSEQHVINNATEARRIGDQFAREWGQPDGAIWDQEW
jgi:hypothetical protein